MFRLYSRLRIRVEYGLSEGSFWRFFEIPFRMMENLVWKWRGTKVVDCFGDSHVAAFRTLNKYPGLCGIHFRTVAINGATASGLGNPNSKTNALRTFTALLKRSPTSNSVLFLIGEVDTGFLIWWRAKKYKKDPAQLMEEALTRYNEFLLAVKRVHKKVIVCSAPLPTIKDGQKFGEVASMRREIRATQKKKTDLALDFNQGLRSWCLAQKIEFCDMDLLSLDENTGLVKEALLNKNPTDHHFDPGEFHRILFEAFDKQGILRKILE